jgi:hypothetical protein
MMVTRRILGTILVGNGRSGYIGFDVGELVAEVEDAVGATRHGAPHLVAHRPGVGTAIRAGAGEKIVERDEHLADIAVAEEGGLGA